MQEHTWEYNDYTKILENIIAVDDKFHILLNQNSNKKQINIKFIITSIVMVISLIMGLIFTGKDIFLISALFKLFGQHIVVYNMVNLAAFLIGGGLIGLGLSFIFEHYLNSQYTSFGKAYVNECILAEKISELILVPFVYAIKELVSNKYFVEGIQISKKTETTKAEALFDLLIDRLIKQLTKEYGYQETYVKQRIEEYLELDQEELYKKMFSLDFNIPVRHNRHYNVSFLRKLFSKNNNIILGPTGDPSYSIPESNDNSNLEKKKKIDNKHVTEVDKILDKILNILDGKTKIKQHLSDSLFSSVKNSKSYKWDEVDTPITKNIEEQTTTNKNKKLIEITD